jgi:hypothetical protein
VAERVGDGGRREAGAFLGCEERVLPTIAEEERKEEMRQVETLQRSYLKEEVSLIGIRPDLAGGDDFTDQRADDD